MLFEVQDVFGEVHFGKECHTKNVQTGESSH